MTICPLCGSPAGAPFLVRASVPVHQNLTEVSPEAARAAPRGRLEMCACPACGFVFNAAFDVSLLRYGPGYDNTQAHSAAFEAHLQDRARHIVETCGVRSARIIEVGCGKGDFLRRLADWPGADNAGIGFDPAYAGPSEACGGRLRFERRPFGLDGAGVAADAVVCRHVIEHVAAPLDLLASVRQAMPAGARAFFETPDVAWILRNAVAWDFFYEHCSLFSAGSLAAAFARAGFAPTMIGPVFGGQYLWLEAVTGAAERLAIEPDALLALARRYGETDAARLASWRTRIGGLARDGRVALWGAGAKGVTFAGLADPDGVRIDCVVDINPAKQGRYVPGSGHPIVAPAALAARGVRHVVLMNPAYRNEVAALLPTRGGARLAEWAA